MFLDIGTDFVSKQEKQNSVAKFHCVGKVFDYFYITWPLIYYLVKLICLNLNMIHECRLFSFRVQNILPQ